MPEVTDEERGRRIFQVHRDRAVESAMEKIRRNLGQDWKLYSALDIEMLKFTLGDCWVFMVRQDWEGCSFTRLSRTDFDGLIRIGKDIKRDDRLEGEGVGRAIEILKKVS